MGQISTVKRQRSWCFQALVLHCSLWQRPNASFPLPFYIGNLTLINLFKTKFLCSTSPLTLHYSFFRNLSFILKQHRDVCQLCGKAVDIILFLTILWTIFCLLHVSRIKLPVIKPFKPWHQCHLLRLFQHQFFIIRHWQLKECHQPPITMKAKVTR